MTRSDRSPQPPLLFLGCLMLGWGLGFLHPLGLGLSRGMRLSLALGLQGIALGLGLWGLLTFKRHGTTPEPNGVATALLTSGPYRFTRNPLYLSLSTTLTAFSLFLDSAWALVLVPGLILLLDRLVITREEARLQAQFGEAYLAYRHRVRRWI